MYKRSTNLTINDLFFHTFFNGVIATVHGDGPTWVKYKVMVIGPAFRVGLNYLWLEVSRERASSLGGLQSPPS